MRVLIPGNLKSNLGDGRLRRAGQQKQLAVVAGGPAWQWVAEYQRHHFLQEYVHHKFHARVSCVPIRKAGYLPESTHVDWSTQGTSLAGASLLPIHTKEIARLWELASIAPECDPSCQAIRYAYREQPSDMKKLCGTPRTSCAPHVHASPTPGSAFQDNDLRLELTNPGFQVG